MELIGMAVLAVIVIAVMVWYGMLKPVETLAHMADDEIQVLAAERKAENVDRLAKITLTEENVAKASANLDKLRSIKL
jgi:hypothetical protein